MRFGTVWAIADALGLTLVELMEDLKTAPKSHRMDREMKRQAEEFVKKGEAHPLMELTRGSTMDDTLEGDLNEDTGHPHCGD